MMEKNIYIDLFAGCGGVSLGLYNSGKWKGLFAVENSPDAFKTLSHNLIQNKSHFEWPTWLPKSHSDIYHILAAYREELLSLRGNVDLVVGGPPCQGFSSAGRRVENDKRNQLILAYIKFIRLVQPKIIFFENVKGFTQKFDQNKVKGKIYSEMVKKGLERSSPVFGYNGYDVYGQLIDFSDYGIPQKRTRFILVGIRKDLNRSGYPKIFFDLLVKESTSFLNGKGISSQVSLKEAISDLLKCELIQSPDSKDFMAGLYNKAESSYQELMRKEVAGNLPDSHRFVNHRGSTIKKFQYILANAKRNVSINKEIKERFNIKKHTVIPLSPDQPSPTITTLPDDYIHYNQPRVFTVREYARIQSFPDWFEFKGKYTTGGPVRVKEVPRYSQIGNAIPPLFGELAGIALNKLMEK